jgi:hypothetical protein
MCVADCVGASIPFQSPKQHTMTMTIQVLFFASAREAAGNITSVELDLPEGSDTTSLRYVVRNCGCTNSIRREEDSLSSSWKWFRRVASIQQDCTYMGGIILCPPPFSGITDTSTHANASFLGGVVTLCCLQL